MFITFNCNEIVARHYFRLCFILILPRAPNRTSGCIEVKVIAKFNRIR